MRQTLLFCYGENTQATLEIIKFQQD